MATFPVLQRLGGQTHNPIVGDFDDTMATDPTIRSRSEGGYVTSRARNTRNPRKWTVKYNWMSQVNKDKVKDFEKGSASTTPVGVSGGSDSFTWTNPEPVVATTHTVRFFGLVSFKAHADTNFLYWMVDFVLEEV